MTQIAISPPGCHPAFSRANAPGSPIDFNALVSGYRRFRETGWARQRDRWSPAAEGEPQVMVIACSDNRSTPPRSSIPPRRRCSSCAISPIWCRLFRTGRRASRGVSAALGVAGAQQRCRKSSVLPASWHACGGVHTALTRRFEHAAPGVAGLSPVGRSLMTPRTTGIIAELVTARRSRRSNSTSRSASRSAPFIPERGCGAPHHPWRLFRDCRRCASPARRAPGALSAPPDFRAAACSRFGRRVPDEEGR